LWFRLVHADSNLSPLGSSTGGRRHCQSFRYRGSGLKTFSSPRQKRFCLWDAFRWFCALCMKDWKKKKKKKKKTPAGFSFCWRLALTWPPGFMALCVLCSLDICLLPVLLFSLPSFHHLPHATFLCHHCTLSSLSNGLYRFYGLAWLATILTVVTGGGRNDGSPVRPACARVPRAPFSNGSPSRLYLGSSSANARLSRTRRAALFTPRAPGSPALLST